MKILFVACLALTALLAWVPQGSTTVIHSRCGKFYCPDHCEISYKNGCPHNCNCKKNLALCPKVTCPADPPTCLIYTQLDGCQSCACRRPFIGVSSATEPTETTDYIILDEEKDQRFDDRTTPLPPLPQTPPPPPEPVPIPAPPRARLQPHEPAPRFQFPDEPQPRPQPPRSPPPRFEPPPRPQQAPPAPQRQRHEPARPRPQPRPQAPSPRFEFPEPADPLFSNPQPQPQFRPEPPRHSNRDEVRFNFGQPEHPQGRRHPRSRIVRKYMCTLGDMDKIDTCMHDMMDYHHNSTHKDTVVKALNPTVKMREKSMHHMCTHMEKSLECIGSKVYKECRYHHPHLTEMDAIYGYPCGKSQNLFFHHYDCIQRAHVNSFRLALCEDQAYRALLHIKNGVQGLRELQEQKCEAMTWLMKCERPVIHGRCSKEAAGVYMDSMMAATEYIAPECYPDYRREVFQMKKLGWKNRVDKDVLAPKDALQCTAEHQTSIVTEFTKLYNELIRMQDKVSAAFPVAYSFNRHQLRNRCDMFKTAMHNIHPDAKRSCIRRFEVYDMVYFGLGYPCGYGTRDYFLRYFDCLVDVKQTSEVVRRCEDLANHRLSDASVDVCETYNVMANCMYDTVVKTCGYDGWEIEYQYLSMNLRNQHDCKLRRIFRTIQAPQTSK